VALARPMHHAAAGTGAAAAAAVPVRGKFNAPAAVLGAAMLGVTWPLASPAARRVFSAELFALYVADLLGDRAWCTHAEASPLVSLLESALRGSTASLPAATAAIKTGVPAGAPRPTPAPSTGDEAWEEMSEAAAAPAVLFEPGGGRLLFFLVACYLPLLLTCC
jgi:hypothetical protein